MSVDFRGLWLLGGAWLAAWFLPPAWVLAPLLAGIALFFALAARARHDPEYATPWFTGPLLLLGAAAAMMLLQGSEQSCQLPPHDSGVSRVIWQYTDTPRVTDEQISQGRGTISAYWDSGRWQHCPLQSYISSELPPPAEASEYISLMRLEPTGARAGIAYWATVAGPIQTHQLTEPSRSESIKAAFATAVDPLPEAGRALLPGMLYGDRSAQDDRLTEAMKISGLSHLTAVSGSNCAIVGGIVMFGLRALGCNRILTLAGLGTSLVLFTVLVGPEPSVLRAAVMGAIAALSLHFGRGRASLGFLCFSATILLLLKPSLSAEAAFALSVLATLGIIVFAPPLTEYLSRLMPTWLAEPVAICAAAQLTCLPVVVALSQSFSLYAIPLNLLVTALIPVITVLGMLCVCLVLAAPGAVGFVVWLPGVPAWGIGELALWAATWPGAQRPWPAGGWGVTLAAGFTLALSVLILLVVHGESTWLRRTTRPVLVLLLVALAALVLPATALLTPAVKPWDIAMCDVGQGDAFVIGFGDSSGWLIDTGPAEAGLLKCLDSLGVSQLERVFITHSHEDHSGGLPELLASPIRVGQIMVSTPAGLEVQAPLHTLKAGDQLTHEQVRMRVLGPSSQAVRHASINDTSLVLLIEIHRAPDTYSFLAAGDMEQQAMANLLAQLPKQHITVLKASHHGARNGGTEILEHFSPRLLLVSVGARNSYGHPHQQILDAAQNMGTRVLRSDLQGTVTITFEGGQAVATRIAAPVR